MKRQVFGLVLPILLTVFAVTLIPSLDGQERRSRVPPQRKAFDENRFPIADFTAPEPSDEHERSKRRVRGRKYDKSSWSVNPEALSDSTVRVDSIDRKLPAFPLGQAKAVVIGITTDAHAYLSNDKSGVYSVFDVRIDEVLLNGSGLPLKNGTIIEAEREGGRVRFPSGKLHLYMISEQGMPHVAGRYVLFLTDGDNGSAFHILTGYELREGLVYPLDDLPNSRVYEKINEEEFLINLKRKIFHH